MYAASLMARQMMKHSDAEVKNTETGNHMSLEPSSGVCAAIPETGDMLGIMERFRCGDLGIYPDVARMVYGMLGFDDEEVDYAISEATSYPIGIYSEYGGIVVAYSAAEQTAHLTTLVESSISMETIAADSSRCEEDVIYATTTLLVLHTARLYILERQSGGDD